MFVPYGLHIVFLENNLPLFHVYMENNQQFYFFNNSYPGLV